MPLINYLGIITILSFVVVLLFTRELRRSYLIFSVCAIPLIDIPVTPGGYGSLRIFDVISYLTFAVLFKEFAAVTVKKSIYYYLYFLLVLLTVLGSLASETVFNSLLSVLTIFPISFMRNY